MPESEYSQDNLAAVRTHLNSLEQMLRFNTATNPNNRAAVMELFAEAAGRAELYLALEGEPKTQVQVAAAMGVNQSTVSPPCLAGCGRSWTSASRRRSPPAGADVP